MASRLCGYCRMGGHRADKCDIKLEHIKEALRHTPKERKFILDTLPKLGFGLGATFRMRNWYNGGDVTCTITSHEWISELQYTQFKKIKYSKQVKITQKESFCRIGDNVLNADNQYGHFNMRLLVIENGTIGEQTMALRYAALVRAKDLSPEQYLNGPGIISFISPSYEPYPYTVEDLTRCIYIHSRLSDKDPDRWSDTCTVTGIAP